LFADEPVCYTARSKLYILQNGKQRERERKREREGREGGEIRMLDKDNFIGI